MQTCRHKVRWLVGVGVILFLVVPFALQADQNPATDSVPRVLPYQGYLHLNGKPLNATGTDAISIRFSLYDGAEPNDTLVYEEDEVVEVFAGRFSVLLGPTGTDGNGQPVTIATVVAGADELYLGITLLNNPGDPADDVPLGGRQLITPVPYALWSTKATDLAVAKDLTVGGTASVTGNTQTGSLSVTNDATVGTNITVTSSTTTGSLTVDGDATVGTAGAVPVNEHTANGNVTVTGTLKVDYDNPGLPPRRVVTDLCLCQSPSSSHGCTCCSGMGWIEVGYWDDDIGGGQGMSCVNPDNEATCALSGSGNYNMTLCVRY